MEIDGHSRLNAEWTSKTQNLVPCLVKCQGRRDFASPSPNKHQTNSEGALISNTKVIIKHQKIHMCKKYMSLKAASQSSMVGERCNFSSIVSMCPQAVVHEKKATLEEILAFQMLFHGK